MEEKNLETEADVAAVDAANADLKANAMNKHESTNPADMDPIDYESLLMEQEHR